MLGGALFLPTVGIPSMMYFGSGNFKQPKLLEFLLDVKARYLVGKGGQMYVVFWQQSWQMCTLNKK